MPAIAAAKRTKAQPQAEAQAELRLHRPTETGVTLDREIKEKGKRQQQKQAAAAVPAEDPFVMAAYVATVVKNTDVAFGKTPELAVIFYLPADDLRKMEKAIGELLLVAREEDTYRKRIGAPEIKKKEVEEPGAESEEPPEKKGKKKKSAILSMVGTDAWFENRGIELKEIIEELETLGQRCYELANPGFDNRVKPLSVLTKRQEQSIFVEFQAKRIEYWLAAYRIPLVAEWAIAQILPIIERNLSPTEVLYNHKSLGLKREDYKGKVRAILKFVAEGGEVRGPEFWEKLAVKFAACPLNPDNLRKVANGVEELTAELVVVERNLRRIRAARRPQPLVAEAARLSTLLGGDGEFASHQSLELNRLRDRYLGVKNYIHAMNGGLQGSTLRPDLERAHEQDKEDVFYDSNPGLLRAIELFDPALGWKFSTSATGWIKQARTATRLNASRGNQVSRTGADRIAEYKAAVAALKKSLGRQPTYDETSKSLGWDREITMNVAGLSRKTRSADAELPTGPDGATGSIVDFEQDYRFPSAQNVAQEKELVGVVADLLRPLLVRERAALIGLYNLDRQGERTSKQIGEQLGIHPREVMRYAREGMDKLRGSGAVIRFEKEFFSDE